MNFKVYLLLFIAGAALAQPADTFQAFRIVVKSTNSDDDSFKKLSAQFEKETDEAAKAKMAFTLGVLNFTKNDMTKAADYFTASLNVNKDTHPHLFRLDDYSHYYLGMIEKEKDPNGAKQHFQAVRTHQPPSSKEADAEIALADIAKTQEKWAEAFSLLVHLEKKHRADSQYSEIIYNLIEASLRSHHSSEACKASLKFYTRFAADSLSKGWGFDLTKVKIAGQNLRCSMSQIEQSHRIDQLIIAGDFEEVRTELKDWSTALAADGKPHPDDLGHLELEMGQLSLTDRKIKEAIAHFLTAQQILGRNPSAQMLLSKAYSQTDDYATAVESYEKVYQMGPRSQLGIKALFQAAFLSYQYRDYDGAARRFEEILTRGRGKIVWDAKWHLAWIRYLKGDYEGATKEFIELSKNKHYAKAADLEKLTYWRGMALFRDGHIQDARAVFMQLAASKRLGYYSGAALARLAVLPQSSAPVPPAPPILPAPTVNPPTTSGSGPTAAATSSAARKPASEESLGGQKEQEKLDEANSQEDEGEGVTPPSDDAASPSMTSLKNPSLVERFHRAEDFIDLGFDSWAVTELREIERRTTNHAYLQSLMAEYLKAGDYFRSALIADNVFQAERELAGVDGAKALWSYAFPQAFAEYVMQDSKKFDVPASLVWGVMRGESGFREEIHSTAGALGLMQLIPPTARQVAKCLDISNFKKEMLLSSKSNILLGTRYLKRLNKTMGNNLPLTIASYNAGPHRVQGWLKDFGDLDLDEFVEHIPYMETRNYVKKVLRNYLVYQTLYTKDSGGLSFLAQKPTIKFSGPKPTSESWDECE